MKQPENSTAGGASFPASHVRTFCRYCEKPEANQHEWETMQCGDGMHLCWGECGVDADEALDNARKEIARLRNICSKVAAYLHRHNHDEWAEWLEIRIANETSPSVDTKEKPMP